KIHAQTRRHGQINAPQRHEEHEGKNGVRSAQMSPCDPLRALRVSACPFLGRKSGNPCNESAAKLAQAPRRLVKARSMRRGLLLLPLALLAGCVPVVNQRGYLPNPAGEAAIKAGADTETTVQAKLGDPSTRATFGNDSWYYISSVERQLAFFD